MLKTLSNKNNSLTCGWFLNFQMPIILLIRNVIFDRIFHVLETNICIDFDVQKCNSYLCDRLWPKTYLKKKSKIKMQLEWKHQFFSFLHPIFTISLTISVINYIENDRNWCFDVRNTNGNWRDFIVCSVVLFTFNNYILFIQIESSNNGTVLIIALASVVVCICLSIVAGAIVFYKMYYKMEQSSGDDVAPNNAVVGDNDKQQSIFTIFLFYVFDILSFPSHSHCL